MKQQIFLVHCGIGIIIFKPSSISTATRTQFTTSTWLYTHQTIPLQRKTFRPYLSKVSLYPNLLFSLSELQPSCLCTGIAIAVASYSPVGTDDCQRPHFSTARPWRTTQSEQAALSVSGTSDDAAALHAISPHGWELRDEARRRLRGWMQLWVLSSLFDASKRTHLSWFFGES